MSLYPMPNKNRFPRKGGSQQRRMPMPKKGPVANPMPGNTGPMQKRMKRPPQGTIGNQLQGLRSLKRG